MIRVEVNGHNVPVSENFSVQIQYENPLFNEEKINVAYSYNISLPITPELQRIYKHQQRLSAKSQNIESQIKIYHSGILFIQGELKITNVSNDSYSCFARNDSLSIMENMKSTKLRVLQLETVTLWPEGTPNIVTGNYPSLLEVMENMIRWKDHMTAITAEPVTQGKYKFPTIKANYSNRPPGSPYDPWEKYRDTREYFEAEKGSVNHFIDDEFHMNSPFDPYESGQRPLIWVNTISPTLRIQYLFEEMIDYLGFVIQVNELNEIIEYLRMLAFSGRVLDKIYWSILPPISNSTYINYHGTEFNLSDFIPDVFMAELFQMLRDMFDMVVTFSDQQIFIELSKNLLDIDSEDMTKYTNDVFVKSLEGIEEQGADVAFDLSDELKLWMETPSVTVDVADEESVIIYGRDFVTGEEPRKEKRATYIPVGDKGIQMGDKSVRMVVTGWPGNPQTVTYPVAQEYAFSLYARMPFNNELQFPISSEVVPNQAAVYDFLAVFQYLGILPTKYKTPAEFAAEDPPSGNMLTNASSSIDGTVTYPSGTAYPYQSWGSKTLFMGESNTQQLGVEDSPEVSNQDTESKGNWNTYHKPLFDFMLNSETIEKELALPPHKIRELANFRKAKHVIDSPEGKFEGFVKTFSVTLYMDRVSRTKITYLSQKL